MSHLSRRAEACFEAIAKSSTRCGNKNSQLLSQGFAIISDEICVSQKVVSNIQHAFKHNSPAAPEQKFFGKLLFLTDCELSHQLKFSPNPSPPLSRLSNKLMWRAKKVCFPAFEPQKFEPQKRVREFREN